MREKESVEWAARREPAIAMHRRRGRHLICSVDVGALVEQVLHHLEMPVLGR